MSTIDATPVNLGYGKDGGDRRRGRNPLARYVRWLHTGWPAGTVERLPRVNADGSTNVPGVYVVGDLTGIPLLKFSSDTGARVVRRIEADGAFKKAPPREGILDLVILGAGVSGMAAALEARKLGLSFEVIEAAEPFATVVNFPKGKPIYTYPTEMTPAGDLQFRADVKEGLVDELRGQTHGIVPRIARAERVVRAKGVLEVHLVQDAGASPPIVARAVIIAIGRSGNFRKLDVPGEEKDKVSNRLFDPKEFADKDVLVVGGGDSALETAIAVAEVGGRVTLSYRRAEFSRAKPDNVERLQGLIADPMADVRVERPTSERVTPASGDFMGKYRRPGSIDVMLGSSVREIGDASVTIVDAGGQSRQIANDAVFTMLGREAPLDFFRRCGIPINGEWRARSVVSLVLVLLFFIFVYHWKKGGVHIADFWPFRSIQTIGDEWGARGWFPYNMPAAWAGVGGAFARKTNVLGVMRVSVGEPGFYYSLAYCVAVTLFGLARIRRRNTPYVKVQTYTLMAVQIVPLFLLPYIVLPWMGNNGWFEGGSMGWVADQLFPKANYGHGREYWRAFGFVLAFPLFFWNVFTDHPMGLWLAISFVQTFVVIPLIVYKWGKGAYCGWICSCGALAETLGDAHRHKMPHGPGANRLNLVGQAFLAFAFGLLVFRSLGWAFPNGFFGRAFAYLFHDLPFLNYVWFVDLLWAGILGVGLYWHFSGRVWCRFACPLAALMHVYARFSRFRILADKKKCISCNVCTSVCHQGIDVMNFANKGLPMEDPQCVRCSACVESCPTGVLSFGEINPRTGQVLRTDKLAASPVRMVELRHNGKVLA